MQFGLLPFTSCLSSFQICSAPDLLHLSRVSLEFASFKPSACMARNRNVYILMKTPVTEVLACLKKKSIGSACDGPVNEQKHDH